MITRASRRSITSYAAATLLPLGTALALAASGCAGQVGDTGEKSEALPVVRGPAVGTALRHDTSAPLTLMPVAGRRTDIVEHEMKRLPRRMTAQQTARDPVLQSSVPALLAPAALLTFEGVGQGFSGPQGTFSVSSAPPDTNGDVGPNHYIQTVNSDFAIFNKSGTPVYGPVPLNTLWSGFGGGCQTNNDGDPIVIYDPIADRWVISQFSVSTTPFLQCVAVSKTSDPTGAYHRYSFSYADFPDYPKMGVWPDAYYTSFNMFNAAGTAFLGGKVCAYDRAKMLTGAAATQQCFQTSTSYGGLLPADLDGARLPPAGAANPVVALGATAGTLAAWRFKVDWTTPANSTFTGPQTITTAAYSEACNGGTCIPQAGTTQKLDALSDRLMYRLAYRNFGDHEAMVVNHAITAGSSVGVRWYELRLNADRTLNLFQQGTFAPDSNYRWMGSAAIDQSGNIGLGYSVSSSTLKPEIRFTGRLAGDAPGTMTQGEGTIIAGGGSQTGSGLSRWGDYSMLGVDPTDDCTFWFTTEYIAANGAFNWHTRIGTFKLPNCGGTAPGNDFSISASPTTISVNQGAAGSSTISTAVTSGAAETVSFSVAGVPAGASASFNPTSVTAGGSSTLSVDAGTAAGGSYSLTITGSSASATHTAIVTLNISQPDYTVSVSPTSGTVAAGASINFSVATTSINGSAQSIALSVSGLPSGVTGAFNPATVTAGGSSTLTLTAASTAASATATFTVTGTSGSTTRTAQAQLTVTASTGGGDTVLTNGVAVSNLSGTQGSQQYFVLAVPAGQSTLTFNLSGGTGDADMYVSFGTRPTTTSYQCRPYLSGNSETCTFNSPSAGNWYVMLRGYTAYSGTSLKGTYSTSTDTTPVLTNGVPITGISGASLSQQYWKLVSVPAGRTATITIAAGTGSSGDADLYVRVGSKPTTSSYHCRPYLSGNNETCNVTNTTSGPADFYIMIRGYSAYTGVTLKGVF